jgi:membrane protein
MAGSIAYSVILSIFPLLLGAISLLGLFLPKASVQDQILSFVQQQTPGLEGLLRDNISAVIQNRGALGIIGIAGLLWSGSGLFGAIHRGINLAWGGKPKTSFFIRKGKQLGAAISSGFFFLISVGATGLVSSSNLISGSLQQAAVTFAGFAMVFIAFLLMYRIMPDTKSEWKYVWLGALAAAALFEIALYLSTFYFSRFADYSRVYGSIASVVVLIVWIYYSAYILILGSEVCVTYSRMKQGLGPKHEEMV